MTAKEVYEGILIELNKLDLSELFIDEFNYFVNKAVYAYVNKRYNLYDTNQQTTDDLQVLKSTKTFEGSGIVHVPTVGVQSPDMTQERYKNALYKTILPTEYYHILNCILYYEIQKDYKCFDKDSIYDIPAKRLTSDMAARILRDAFQRPSWKNPYYFIQNTERQVITDWNANGYAGIKPDDAVLNKKAGTKIAHNSFETVTQDTNNHYGPTMEIRYGKDMTVFKLVKVDVDYLKVPGYIRLTPDHIDMTDDKSQVMEFPDYICQEIIKEATTLILENKQNQRIQTFPVVNQTIPQSLPQQQQVQG